MKLDYFFPLVTVSLHGVWVLHGKIVKLQTKAKARVRV